MKVLMVIDGLGRGGAERLLVTLLPELVRQGCNAEVAVLRGPYDLEPDLLRQGIAVHRFPKIAKWNLLRRARVLAQLVDHSGADIVHAHLYFPAVTTAVMRWARLHKARTFVTFHNLAYAGANRAGPGLWAKKQIARFLYPRGIDGFLAVSRSVACHYRDALGLPEPQILYNPISLPQRVTPAPLNRPLRIVVPGRLVQEKGHEDLIQALTWLETPHQVVFAGGGPLQQRLAELAPQVRITGPLVHDMMMEEIAKADLVVVPSRFEGFGLTALEAMALGRPVVCTDAGGLPEVVGDAGRIVPAANPEALANAIQSMLASVEDRRIFAERGRARAKAEFSLQTIAARQIAIYQVALSRGAA